MSKTSEKGSHYVKTSYSGEIRVRNSETHEMETITTNRTVYQNTEIDPNMIIPKGTKIGKETLQKDMTNLERMSDGKAPLVAVQNNDGSTSYERIELHHLTGRELQPETAYFNGELQDGTLVEIRSSVHDAPQIHNLNEKNNSFRKSKVETVDEDGKTVRSIEKSYDAVHYERTREQYWHDRAAAITEEKSVEKGEDTMSWLDKFRGSEPEKQETTTQTFAEQRQSFIDSIKVDNSTTQAPQTTTNNNNDDNSNNSAPDPMEKGDAYDVPGTTDQNEESNDENEMDMDDDMEL